MRVAAVRAPSDPMAEIGRRRCRRRPRTRARRCRRGCGRPRSARRIRCCVGAELCDGGAGDGEHAAAISTSAAATVTYGVGKVLSSTVVIVPSTRMRDALPGPCWSAWWVAASLSPHPQACSTRPCSTAARVRCRVPAAVGVRGRPDPRGGSGVLGAVAERARQAVPGAEPLVPDVLRPALIASVLLLPFSAVRSRRLSGAADARRTLPLGGVAGRGRHLRSEPGGGIARRWTSGCPRREGRRPWPSASRPRGQCAAWRRGGSPKPCSTRRATNRTTS